eukprot:19846_1
MPFNLATTHKVISVEVVYYSVINNYDIFKTHTNQFQNTFPLQTASTKMKYHQEIDYYHAYGVYEPEFFNTSLSGRKVAVYATEQGTICVFIRFNISNWCI